MEEMAEYKELVGLSKKAKENIHPMKETIGEVATQLQAELIEAHNSREEGRGGVDINSSSFTTFMEQIDPKSSPLLRIRVRLTPSAISSPPKERLQ